MVKKVIKFTDFNGEEQVKEYWFNFTKTELLRMQYSGEGDYAEKLRRIAATNSAKDILPIFEEIITKSYGVKSIDGISFVKDPAATKAFIESPAYDEFFFEMLQNPKSFAEFLKKLLPHDLEEQVKKLEQSGEYRKQLGLEEVPSIVPVQKRDGDV